MSEQSAPPQLEEPIPGLQGGISAHHEMAPGSFMGGESEREKVKFVGRHDNPRSIILLEDERFILDSYGDSGEPKPKEPFVIKVDSDGNEQDRMPFSEYVDRRDANVEDGEVQVASDESAAEQVFHGVVKRLSDRARKGRTSKNVLKQDPATGEYASVDVDVDPAAEFVEQRFSGLEKVQNVINGRGYRDIASDTLSELHSKGLETATMHRGEIVISEAAERTEKLISLGRVDSKTAQYFWGELNNLKSGLSLNYNTLVKKEDSPEGPIDQAAYQRGLNEALSVFDGRIHEQESGGFVHVNSELSTEEGHRPMERLYISSKADGDPARVIKIWSEMLDDLGLKESVYFKVPQAVENRYEGLVMYRLDSMSDEDFTQLVEEFSKRCPSELLNPEPMPTGVEVVPGVFTAPEPSGLNKLLRYATRKDAESFDMVSYNQLAGGMSELALRLAASDFQEKGIDQTEVTPKRLAEVAESYFGQLMILSNIDPETMTDRSG